MAALSSVVVTSEYSRGAAPSDGATAASGCAALVALKSTSAASGTGTALEVTDPASAPGSVVVAGEVADAVTVGVKRSDGTLVLRAARP